MGGGLLLLKGFGVEALPEPEILWNFEKFLVSRQGDVVRRFSPDTRPDAPELIAAIQEYLENHNQNPKIFTWTASVEQILAKVAKCKEVLETLH